MRYVGKMIARQAIYSGRVQRVGFRYSTKQIAMGFDVIGWVRNLPDGRVELQVRGEEEEVVDFLEEIRENSNLSHHILEYELNEISTEELNDVKGFSIQA
jgi:acylphosphatase